MLNEKESDNRKIVELSHGAAAAEVDGVVSMGGAGGLVMVQESEIWMIGFWEVHWVECKLISLFIPPPSILCYGHFDD